MSHSRRGLGQRGEELAVRHLEAAGLTVMVRNWRCAAGELDVVITKDKKVVVSHEPWISHEICLKPDSTTIKKSEEKGLNIYQMTYDRVKSYDCGSKVFPNSKKWLPASLCSLM